MDLKRFIFNYSKYKRDFLFLKEITKIKENAFKDDNTLQFVQFDVDLITIESNAFENCQNLEVFAIGMDIPESIYSRDNQRINSIKGKELQIQKEAFKNCNNLHTVILGTTKKLYIEKDAFSDCDTLRTVVCRTQEISFTGNPFSDCSKSLTFVGKKDSELERFVRENGYGFIDD